MVVDSLSRQITEVLLRTESETARVWGTNAMGRPAGLLVNRLEGKGPSASLPSSGSEMLAAPVLEEDVELVTVPDPEQFVLLPGEGTDDQPPPVGATFCDVYSVDNGSLSRMKSAESIEEPTDLNRGVTGPGVEFFYPEDLSNVVSTRWDLALPRFRDNMTPSLPEETVQALFRYGESGDVENTGESLQRDELPHLKSAV